MATQTETETVAATEYPDGIRQALERLEVLRRTVRSKIDLWRKVQGVADQYRDKYPQDTVTMEMSVSTGQLLVDVITDDLRRIKYPLKLLREAGFRVVHRKTEPGLGASLMYLYKDLMLHAYPSKNSACRRVQVGERTNTEPIYRWECDGKPVTLEEG